MTPAGSVSVTDTLAASDGPALRHDDRVASRCPAAVTVTGPDFTTDRSAEAVTVVDADEELLPLFGSGVALDTATALFSVAAWAGAVTTTVIVGAVAPVASAGRVQVTDTFPAFVQAQPAARRRRRT